MPPTCIHRQQKRVVELTPLAFLVQPSTRPRAFRRLSPVQGYPVCSWYHHPPALRSTPDCFRSSPRLCSVLIGERVSTRRDADPPTPIYISRLFAAAAVTVATISPTPLSQRNFYVQANGGCAKSRLVSSLVSPPTINPLHAYFSHLRARLLPPRAKLRDRGTLI